MLGCPKRLMFTASSSAALLCPVQRLAPWGTGIWRNFHFSRLKNLPWVELLKKCLSHVLPFFWRISCIDRLALVFSSVWPWSSDPLLPECWDYKDVPSHLVYRILGIKARASYMRDKHSTNWGTFPALSRLIHACFLLLWPWLLVSMSARCIIHAVTCQHTHFPYIPITYPGQES